MVSHRGAMLYDKNILFCGIKKKNMEYAKATCLVIIIVSAVQVTIPSKSFVYNESNRRHSFLSEGNKEDKILNAVLWNKGIEGTSQIDLTSENDDIDTTKKEGVTFEDSTTAPEILLAVDEVLSSPFPKEVTIQQHSDSQDNVTPFPQVEKKACIDPPTYESLSNDPEHYFKDINTINQKELFFDVVIIPSGGLDDFGNPNSFTKARLDAAGNLKNRTRYFLSTGAFTLLKPTRLSVKGHPITEARSDALYLTNQYNISNSQLILEEISKDTLGNAFFSRRICELLHSSDVLVITNRFHMPRVKATFDWVFSLPEALNTLYYLEVPDSGLSETDIHERTLKEQNSLKHFLCQTKPNVSSMKKLAKFIYFGHRAYAMDENVGIYDVKLSREALVTYNNNNRNRI